MGLQTNDLVDQFTQEARDILQSIGERLLAIERAPTDTELLNDLFRQVHTLKGNCGLFDFGALESVVHAAEDLLDRVRSHELAYSGHMADVILDAMDLAAELVEAIATAGQLPPNANQAADKHLVALRALIEGGPTPDTAAPPAETANGLPTEPASSPRPAWVGSALAMRPEHANSGITALIYQPEPDCFFKGEDPWLLVQATPGLVWLDVAPMVQPARDGQWDCYRCEVVFRLLSTAPQAYLEEHFRFVGEQVNRWTVESNDPTAPGLPANGALDAASHQLLSTHTRQLAADQCELLKRTDLSPNTLGSVRQVLTALHKVNGNGTTPTEAPRADTPDALLDWAQALMSNPATGATPPEGLAPEPNGWAAAGLPDNGTTADTKLGLTAAEDPAHRVLKISQEKVDHLMDLIGEMVVAKNGLPYLAARAERVHDNRELAREIKAQYAVINRIAEDMQRAIMQVRMLPVGTVFKRFNRLVRDISRRLGKEVDLVVAGDDTEADKNVIEALAEPLVHVLRNSLDHGIESPAERVRAGKKPAGTIEVFACQEGDRVVIDIKDDGAGIDTQRVKSKAVAKGLIDSERANAMTDAELQQLVFLPSFSTADTVSDLSGRGVGMDAVRTAVERVNGTVKLVSTQGKGTSVQLSLPLSMAVTNVMVVETADRRFGIPMDMIVETVRIPLEGIHTFKHSKTAVLRGRIVPLLDMNGLLGLGEAQQLNDTQEHAVLVVRSGSGSVGLVVDDFHGTSDIILKPLEGVLSSLNGFAGTALMGDGSVLLVLNPKELI